MGKVMSIANQKGGVGKTTTAINLSSALAVLEKKVLLIDLDPQSNATSGLGFKDGEVDKSIYDCLTGAQSIEDTIYPTQIPNLDLVPATIDLVGAEIDLVSASRREFVLKDRIDQIREKYDFIIIDCLPSLGVLTVNALVASDSVLIPVQSEFYSLEGLGKLKDTIQIIQKNLNSKLEIEGILITMFDQRLRMANMVVDNIKKIVSDHIYETIIHRNSKLNEAPMLGKPILKYDASAVGAKNYLNLANEILTRNSN